MALEMKVITPETKNALLVAQAAERTYLLAEKAQILAEKHDEMVGARRKADTADFVGHGDPVFKFVGSDRDPPALQRAQATWMAAQILLNNEIAAINCQIDLPDHVANELSEGPEAAQGFKRVAADLYAEAGRAMAAEGHLAAGEKFAAVSNALASAAGNGPSPSETMESIAANFRRSGQDLTIILNDERYMARQPVEDVYEKLARLTRTPDGSLPNPGPKPAVG